MDDPKAKLVRAWLVKANRDLGSAKRLASEPAAYLDTAIYHCQQAAEKTLKAFLVYRDVVFEKVHNLSVLLEYCADIDPAFRDLADAAADLTPYATAFRYPDEFFESEPDKEQFDQALKQAEQILQFVLQRLPKDTLP
jgi:HEPN domain-containing protein